MYATLNKIDKVAEVAKKGFEVEPENPERFVMLANLVFLNRDMVTLKEKVCLNIGKFNDVVDKQAEQAKALCESSGLDEISLVTSEADSVKKEYYSNGQLWYEVPYKDGNKNGIARQYYDDGKLWRVLTFKDDKLNGVVQEYARDGRPIKQETYKDDFLHGISKECSSLECKSGELPWSRVTPYALGKREGDEKYFVGYFLSIIPYKEDQSHGVAKEYYPNGQLKQETPYKWGEIDGVSKTYHPNGQLNVEISYKDGKKDGYGKAFYMNGQLLGEVFYVNDKVEGVVKLFDNQGILKYEVPYKDGESQREQIKKYADGKIEYSAWGFFFRDEIKDKGDIVWLMNDVFQTGEVQESFSPGWNPSTSLPKEDRLAGYLQEHRDYFKRQEVCRSYGPVLDTDTLALANDILMKTYNIIIAAKKDYPELNLLQRFGLKERLDEEHSGFCFWQRNQSSGDH